MIAGTQNKLWWEYYELFTKLMSRAAPHAECVYGCCCHEYHASSLQRQMHATIWYPTECVRRTHPKALHHMKCRGKSIKHIHYIEMLSNLSSNTAFISIWLRICTAHVHAYRHKVFFKQNIFLVLQHDPRRRYEDLCAIICFIYI